MKKMWEADGQPGQQMGTKPGSFVMMLPHTWLQLLEQVRSSCQMGPGRLGRECYLRSHAVSSRQGCTRPSIPGSSFIRQIFAMCVRPWAYRMGKTRSALVNQGDRR